MDLDNTKMDQANHTDGTPLEPRGQQELLPAVAEVQKIGIKVPPFWHDCPEIWFAQIEAQFAVGKITSDNARYNTVVASIESKVLCQVSDAVLNPPAAAKYENLKRVIVSRYSESAQCKI